MSGRSKLETIKERSRQLRGTIGETLAGDAEAFGEADKQLLKFHGLYQQDDRDLRAERKRAGLGKAHRFMVRSSIPGGRLTAAQYRAHDDLATAFANGTLRITTRQGLQLHGVIKRDLDATLRGINETLVTTLGACGDVVRNVMGCPLPADDPLRKEIRGHVLAIARHFRPHTRAYHEIWLDGERYGTAGIADEEPVYGTAYLPRKFKIAVAHPGDNCVDVLTQDVGIVARADGQRLAGFDVLVGGGLGMTHTKPGTFPRLADPLAFVLPEDLLATVDAIVAVQRDHGDRADRRHARLKYLIHDRGLDWFRAQVAERLGRRLSPPMDGLPGAPRLHLGWQRQDDASGCLGLFVENGRIADRGRRRLRSGVRAVVDRFSCDVVLTPQQDLLFTGIPVEQREELREILEHHGVRDEASPVRRRSMACPALPTCGLALAEAERALPSVIDELETTLDELGLAGEPLTVRMTGCPNGCARPYVAELGLVGRTADRYVVLVGGAPDGTRLNTSFEDLVPREAIVSTVRPLLEFFRDAREDGERFGDFCHRVGVRVLRAYVNGLKAVGHGC